MWFPITYITIVWLILKIWFNSSPLFGLTFLVSKTILILSPIWIWISSPIWFICLLISFKLFCSRCSFSTPSATICAMMMMTSPPPLVRATRTIGTYSGSARVDHLDEIKEHYLQTLTWDYVSTYTRRPCTGKRGVDDKTYKSVNSIQDMLGPCHH